MTDTRAPMPGAEALIPALRDRWSISVYDDTHALSVDEIQTLLQAARWAPSAGNGQPWGFVVAERGTPVHKVLVEQLSRGNSGWVPRASVVFVAVAQVAPDPEGRGPTWPEYSFYDLGQAAAHLTVQAHAMGLHVHQFAGFDGAAFGERIGAPAWWRVLTGIAVGLPGDPEEVPEADRAREHRPRTRKPLTEVAHGEAWGSPWEGLTPGL